MSREPTSAPTPVAPGVEFELERFEWTSADRLELVGRWVGLRGHRFLRPTLDVEVGGERRRMLADLEHKPWAPQEGEDWIAVFTWRGDPARFDDAELTVSPELAVQLPAPGGSVDEVSVSAPAAERRPARRPRSAVLEGELAAALAEAERLSDELERARTRHSEAAKDLRERLRGEAARIRDLEDELEQAREEARTQLGVAETAAQEEAERLRQERDTATSERTAAMSERDAALAAAERASAERDEALRKLSAAESERDALTEARDRARQERNAWMQRARAAKAGGPSLGPEARSGLTPAPAKPQPGPDARPAAPPLAAAPGPADASDPESGAIAPGSPAPPTERRTIQIGERPGPPRPAPVQLGFDRGARPFLEAWGPRLAALVAIVVVVLILVLLLT